MKVANYSSKFIFETPGAENQAKSPVLLANFENSLQGYIVKFGVGMLDITKEELRTSSLDCFGM